MVLGGGRFLSEQLLHMLSSFMGEHVGLLFFFITLKPRVELYNNL